MKTAHGLALAITLLCSAVPAMEARVLPSNLVADVERAERLGKGIAAASLGRLLPPGLRARAARLPGSLAPPLEPGTPTPRVAIIGSGLPTSSLQPVSR